MPGFSLRGFWEVLKEAGSKFKSDKVTKLSASLAYYTIFSIGPVLLIVIYLANIFWGQAAIEGKIIQQIQDFTGKEAATQVQEVIKNASIGGTSTLTGIIGFATLLIAATTVFAEMQDSINFIWKLRVKKVKASWKKTLWTRLTSFSIVISLGFILLVSLVINAIMEGFIDKIQELFPQIAFALVYVINIVVTLIIITLLFGIIFKVLPDAKIQWKDVIVGAVFTAILFMIGKFGITLYITKSDIGSSYGAAGSLVVLLLWVYFSSTILYFGAEFTKAYAMKFGSEIRPNVYTVTVQMVEVESNEKSIQENEKKAKHIEKKVKQESQHADKS